MTLLHTVRFDACGLCQSGSFCQHDLEEGWGVTSLGQFNTTCCCCCSAAEEHWKQRPLRCRQLPSHLMGWKAEHDVLGQLPLHQKAILSLLTRQQLSGQEPPSRGSCSMFSAEAYACTALYQGWCQKNARSQLHVCQAQCSQRLACCTQVI